MKAHDRGKNWVPAQQKRLNLENNPVEKAEYERISAIHKKSEEKIKQQGKQFKVKNPEMKWNITNKPFMNGDRGIIRLFPVIIYISFH